MIIKGLEEKYVGTNHNNFMVVYCFINNDTKNGIPHDTGANIHTTIISFMQGIVDHVYSSKNVSSLKGL